MACSADGALGWEFAGNAKAENGQLSFVTLSAKLASNLGTSPPESRTSSGYSSTYSSWDIESVHDKSSYLDDVKAVLDDNIDACSVSSDSDSLHMLDEQTKGPNVIVFDWDDTLFPTSFMQGVLQQHGLQKVTPSSAFYQELRRHAQFVESILRTARKVANVAIVTLAGRSWVNVSAERYLPGLCIQDLLEELKIPVYYAIEYIPVKAHFVEAEEVDLHVIAKRNAMNKFIKKVCKTKGAVSHIVSIGDSRAEAEALKEIVWTTLENSHCTTVHLLDSPSLEDLTDEIEHLIEAVPQLVCAEDDAEFHMRNWRDEGKDPHLGA